MILLLRNICHLVKRFHNIFLLSPKNEVFKTDEFKKTNYEQMAVRKKNLASFN